MSLIQRKTFTLKTSAGEARITVRSSSGFTDSRRQAIIRRLVIACGSLSEDGEHYKLPEELEVPVVVFATIVANTESIEGLPFEWPSSGADGETLKAAMMAFDERLPAGADTLWSTAIIEVDAVPDPELSPVGGDEGKSSAPRP